MSDKFFSYEHLCFTQGGDGLIVVSVALHMALRLAPTFARLPDPGDRIPADVPVGGFESRKASFELTLPFACIVSEVNRNVLANPKLIMEGEAEGWLIKVAAKEEGWKSTLMNERDYGDFIAP